MRLSPNQRSRRVEKQRPAAARAHRENEGSRRDNPSRGQKTGPRSATGRIQRNRTGKTEQSRGGQNSEVRGQKQVNIRQDTHRETLELDRLEA